MKLECKDVGMINADNLIAECQKWQDELLEDDIYDSIIYSTLDSVIDLIIESGE